MLRNSTSAQRGSSVLNVDDFLFVDLLVNISGYVGYHESKQSTPTRQQLVS